MISKDKEYTTRDGKDVRIYATDGLGDYPIHGAILLKDGWLPQYWTDEGIYAKSCLSHGHDLIEKPKTKKVWIEVWMNKNGDMDCQLHTEESTAKAGERVNENSPLITHLEIIEREYPVKTEER